MQIRGNSLFFIKVPYVISGSMPKTIHQNAFLNIPFHNAGDFPLYLIFLLLSRTDFFPHATTNLFLLSDTLRKNTWFFALFVHKGKYYGK